MGQRRQPLTLKYWPVTVSILAAFALWDLYSAHAESRSVDWFWLGLCGAGIVAVLILQWVLRERKE